MKHRLISCVRGAEIRFPTLRRRHLPGLLEHKVDSAIARLCSPGTNFTRWLARSRRFSFQGASARFVALHRLGRIIRERLSASFHKYSDGFFKGLVNGPFFNTKTRRHEDTKVLILCNLRFFVSSCLRVELFSNFYPI